VLATLRSTHTRKQPVRRIKQRWRIERTYEDLSTPVRGWAGLGTSVASAAAMIPRNRTDRGSSYLITAQALAMAACAEPDGVGVDERESAIVYGADDRLDYFQVADQQLRSVARKSLVAFIPRKSVVTVAGRPTIDAPLLGEQTQLCENEPFFDQPEAAFCSGVLVDWDLVLTAGHCVRWLALRDFVVVFGYYYQEPGTLALSADEIFDAEEIVAEALDGAGVVPRLDYAWVRLSRPVRSPLSPAAIRSFVASATEGEALTVIGAGGGVPLKIDQGASLRDARGAWHDYFTASSDTAHGASGGGAFDYEFALLGVLARGGTDLTTTERGCQVTNRAPEEREPEEEFTYAATALSGLCHVAPESSSLCRADCGDPCVALPVYGEGGGQHCALSTRPTARSPLTSALGLWALGLALWRRRSKRARPL
jgi:hypothetical protein